MRNVTTYRICAAVCIAMVPVGGLREEVLTVVLAGLGALYCLRWARIEREREEAHREYMRRLAQMRSDFEDVSRTFGEALLPAMRNAADAFRSFGEAMSHVRVIHPEDPVRPPK